MRETFVQRPNTRSGVRNKLLVRTLLGKGVPNATFVSSAGRKATRVGDCANVPKRFSFLRAKLRAERPGLIVLLMLATLAGLQCSIRADESVSTNTPLVTTTNSIALAALALNLDTNQLSISTNEPASRFSGTTNQPFGDGPSSTASVIVVIQERSDSGRFSDQSGNGSFGFANIEAGFGQVYENDSIVMRGRNGTAWEETRYLFFKKVVKF